MSQAPSHATAPDDRLLDGRPFFSHQRVFKIDNSRSSQRICRQRRCCVPPRTGSRDTSRRFRCRIPRRGCDAPRPRTRDNRTESPCRPEDRPGTLTYKPGSKTETLATASQRPIPARWHTSALCDYAESFYEGTYQRHQAQFDRDFQSSEAKLILSDSPVEVRLCERDL